MYDMEKQTPPKTYQIRYMESNEWKKYFCTAYSEDEALQCHENFCDRNQIYWTNRYWKIVDDVAGF